MPQVDQRYGRATIYWSAHPQEEQDKTEKPSYGLDWLQKGIWYGPTKLDNRHVHDIQWSHKVYQKYHWKLESQADSRRKKLSRSENPGRDFPRRCNITIPILIAMRSLNHILRKCTGQYKFHKSQEKINHLMYMDDIKLFVKNEKELVT